MFIERLGESGPTVVLVHGSVAAGWATWEAQRPLADRYRLVVPHRTGYPPNPPLERIDFEVQAGEIAELIEPGTHLVGHSYGGVVSLMVAGIVPERIASLTVIEPPAFGLVRGVPAVEELIARIMQIFADTSLSPREFIERFAPLVGATLVLPDPLPPAMEDSIRASMHERQPMEAQPPLEAIARSPFPRLVFSGGHSPAFEAVCDLLADRLDAERAVITGRGHSVPRTGEPFNERLRTFIDAA